MSEQLLQAARRAACTSCVINVVGASDKRNFLQWPEDLFKTHLLNLNWKSQRIPKNFWWPNKIGSLKFLTPEEKPPTTAACVPCPTGRWQVNYRCLPLHPKKTTPSKIFLNQPVLGLSRWISIVEIEDEFVWDFELSGEFLLSVFGLSGTHLYLVKAIPARCTRSPSPAAVIARRDALGYQTATTKPPPLQSCPHNSKSLLLTSTIPHVHSST